MKNTVATFAQAKAEGRKLAMLTAYDYSTAKLEDEAGIDGILIGDSLGNVVLGYEDTLSVTVEDMIHHSAAVARGAKNALIVCDMPFLSYEVSVPDAVRNAGRLLKEGRANCVKLEGGEEVCPQVAAIDRKYQNLHNLQESRYFLFPKGSAQQLPARKPHLSHLHTYASRLLQEHPGD